MARGWHAVLAAICQSMSIPSDLLRSVVIPLWKGKGDHWDCSNYRDITLLSIPGKVFAHFLLKQISNHLLSHQRPEQSGFTPASLYASTESAVKYSGGLSSFFPVNSTLFNTCVDLRIGRAIQSHCGTTLSNIKVTDLDFAADDVILSETLESLVAALVVISNEAKPLGLQVF
ncbi:uncharacterized protein [Penaeus vannamei]|uniref:uncharacterized protein n=1 Tax=Penaeus vannamei TaxID=6689 RepID=UPI00387F5B19